MTDKEAQKQIIEEEGIYNTREVVEWVDRNIAFANVNLSYKEWQAFKKSKGID